jgi:hypothetical protein
MKFFSIRLLLGIAAILVAGCAAFFSVTGLGLLFHGASASVMIMASVLEYAKLVSASYLKQSWHKIGRLLKLYLTIAVVILMFLTSVGIFGFLSDAFQKQSILLDKVDREILVLKNKIDINKSEISRYSLQITNLSSIRNSQESNISKIIERQQSTSRISGMIKSADKEISNLSKKIDSLSVSNNRLFQQIDSVKNENIGLEQQVGGFRFVAEAFGVELKKAVKYFILLIVFVFDPLAIALVLAFNNKSITFQEPKIEEILPKPIEEDLTKKKRTRGRPK